MMMMMMMLMMMMILFLKIEFLQRVSIACYAERGISYSKSVRPSVRLSVRHTLALSQNDSSYDHGGLHWRIAP